MLSPLRSPQRGAHVVVSERPRATPNAATVDTLYASVCHRVLAPLGLLGSAA